MFVCKRDEMNTPTARSDSQLELKIWCSPLTYLVAEDSQTNAELNAIRVKRRKQVNNLASYCVSQPWIPKLVQKGIFFERPS